MLASEMIPGTPEADDFAVKVLEALNAAVLQTQRAEKDKEAN